MNNKLLKISIVTVCKNPGSAIERTIQSVIQQTHPALEYIIIDGTSDDGTQELIEKYTNSVSKVISEPDNGIYDAMNKGISQSTGDFIAFLNAGDYLIHPTVVEIVVQKIRQAKWTDIDVVYGDVITFEPTNGRAWIGENRPLSKLSLYSGSLPHPATLHHRDAFKKNGLYNSEFKIAGDYEWFVRGHEKNSLSFRHLNVVMAVFINDGISTDAKWRLLHEQEKRRLHEMHYSKYDQRILKIGQFLRKNKIIR